MADARRIWPDWDPAWVVHEDEAILVVAKPAGVPAQAADPERPDDAVTRLRAWLVARGAGDSYMGVHQRLDRDTSGVVVYARAKAANASLAAQFEGRKVDKTYLAAVTGWPAGRDRVVLRDAIAVHAGVARVVETDARREGGRRQGARRERGASVGPERAPAGTQLAVTHVEVRARRGDRALLELRLETGRTHQARVQLTHAGAPIAGDVLYGGAPASRLMLHAGRIGLAHPTTGRRVTYEAPAPPELEAWLACGDEGEAVYEDAGALARALSRARERRFGLGRAASGPRATTAFRLVNEAGDALPGLAVDVYGGFLVAQFYEGTFAWDEARRTRVLDALGELGFDGVYVKHRPKQANVIVDARREEFAPRLPARGGPAPDELVVMEEGLPYGVRLADGLSTGIFLDQRENRRRVRALAAAGARSVLNLFAYTCGFTVAAAAGGATRTVSVDASVAALERGHENLARAGLLTAGEHSVVAEDAFTWLARAARKGDRFDLVILDPPSYSTTRARRFSAVDDLAELVAAAMRVVAPGGALLACTNHRGIVHARFRRELFEAARAAGREATQVKDLPDPADFPAPPGAESHLKSALVRL